MRLIDDGDERLFYTMTVAARLGRADRIVPSLLADYDEHWDDPEASFRYALALVAMIEAHRNEQETYANYRMSMEALDDVIESVPGHWLARYCRLRHRVLIRTGFGKFQEYLHDERDQALADARELLRHQEQVPWQPYFSAACLLAAKLYIGQGDQPQAARLVDDAGERPHAKVPYPALASLMVAPCLVLYHDAIPPPMKAVVGTTMARLFPDHPAVRSALATGRSHAGGGPLRAGAPA
jgi:hypothetical protein